MSEERSNAVIDYASQRYSYEPAVVTTPTEIVAETPTETPSETLITTEIVEPTITPETANANPVEQEQTQVDYSKFLSESSEGLFTDVDSFKSAIPKIKEYDLRVSENETLLKQKEELEAKLNVDPFVNEFTKTLDSMIRAGKSADEIENFTKISRLNLDEISSVDAKVMVMVKNGYSESIARQKVERDFPIEEHEEGSVERSILEEELRVSSLQDRQILKDYKKELTAVDTSAQQAAQNEAERLKLDGIAKLKAHTDFVKQSVPKIVENIQGLGEVNLNGKKDAEALNLNFDYNDEFKSLLSQKLEAFFLDGQMEVNDENIAEAKRYIKADYLERNFEQIAQSIAKHVESVTAEKYVNKYENRTGLPAETGNVVTTNNDNENFAFLQKIANRR